MPKLVGGGAKLLTGIETFAAVVAQVRKIRQVGRTERPSLLEWPETRAVLLAVAACVTDSQYMLTV